MYCLSPQTPGCLSLSDLFGVFRKFTRKICFSIRQFFTEISAAWLYQTVSWAEGQVRAGTLPCGPLMERPWKMDCVPEPQFPLLYPWGTLSAPRDTSYDSCHLLGFVGLFTVCLPHPSVLRFYTVVLPCALQAENIPDKVGHDSVKGQRLNIPALLGDLLSVLFVSRCLVLPQELLGVAQGRC